MTTAPITVNFPGASIAEGNRLASTLADTLRDVDLGVTVDRLKERPETQDLGATVGIMLGTASATALAKGIAAWMARNSGARIEIRRKGEVVLVATGLDNSDIPRIAEAISPSK